MEANLEKLFRLNLEQIPPASEILAQAFQDDPLLMYYFPNESNRKEKSKYIFEYSLGFTIRYGEVYAISPDLEGIAAWKKPKDLFATPDKQIECGAENLIAKLGRAFLKKASPIEDFLLDLHKKIVPFPHWYLSPIAVDPQYQGKGYASILLRAMFSKVDQLELPIYLQTHTEANVSIYEHFGFSVIKELSIPNTEVYFWGMLRDTSK